MHILLRYLSRLTSWTQFRVAFILQILGFSTNHFQSIWCCSWFVRHKGNFTAWNLATGSGHPFKIFSFFLHTNFLRRKTSTRSLNKTEEKNVDWIEKWIMKLKNESRELKQISKGTEIFFFRKKFLQKKSNLANYFGISFKANRIQKKSFIRLFYFRRPKFDSERKKSISIPKATKPIAAITAVRLWIWFTSKSKLVIKTFQLNNSNGI